MIATTAGRPGNPQASRRDLLPITNPRTEKNTATRGKMGEIFKNSLPASKCLQGPWVDSGRPNDHHPVVPDITKQMNDTDNSGLVQLENKTAILTLILRWRIFGELWHLFYQKMSDLGFD
ncbi:MAG: hypothetical protein V4689_04740 [Verrucomicrobiota bacterium]